MNKTIENVLDPILLDLFQDFKWGGNYKISKIKERFYELFNKFDNDEIKKRSLSYRDYYSLCKEYIYYYQYENDFIHILRCILRVQRDMGNKELMLLESNGILGWTKEYYKRIGMEYLIDDEDYMIWES